MLKSDQPTLSPTAPRAAATLHAKGVLLPILAAVVTLVLQALILRLFGRPWWCACGSWRPWSGDIWSPHNSQHFADPYSFTHILHGLLLYGLLTWVFPRGPWRWRLVLAVALEAAWEILENSPFIIDRYRTATISLDYYGDSILNSVSDVAFCAAGVLLARRLGFWRSAAFFLLTEAVLLLWIRDSLLLNLIMLIHPIQALKAWQMPG